MGRGRERDTGREIILELKLFLVRKQSLKFLYFYNPGCNPGCQKLLQKSPVMYKHENIFRLLISLTRDNTVEKDVKEEAYGIWPLVTG